MRWLVVLLALPLATAAGIDNPTESVESRLYLHIDGWQEVALNPLPPPESFATSDPPSPSGHSLCLQTPGQTLTDQRYHTWYAVVSPLPIQYRNNSVESNPQRGIAADLDLDATRGVDVVWFMRAEDAVVVPEVVMRATMRGGDTLSVGQVAMDTGRIIGINETRPATLSPTLDHPDVIVHDAGPETVYEFRLHVPITGDPFITQAESFNLRLDVYIDSPVCDQAYAMPGPVKAHSSPTHRPAIDLALHNPVAIQRVEARLIDEVLELTAQVAAPFGPSDAILRTDQGFQIDAAVSLTLPDWGAGRTDGERAYPVLHRTTEYQLRQTWSFATDGADGTYDVSLQIPTMSGAVARADMPIRVGDVVETCTMLHSGAPTCAAHVLHDKQSPLPLAWTLVVLALATRRR